MKTIISTLLFVLLNVVSFAQEAAVAVEKVEPSAMQQTLGGRPLLTSFFWSVLILLVLALAVVVRAYLSNRVKA